MFSLYLYMVFNISTCALYCYLYNEIVVLKCSHSFVCSLRDYNFKSTWLWKICYSLLIILNCSCIDIDAWSIRVTFVTPVIEHWWFKKQDCFLYFTDSYFKLWYRTYLQFSPAFQALISYIYNILTCISQTAISSLDIVHIYNFHLYFTDSYFKLWYCTYLQFSPAFHTGISSLDTEHI